MIVILTILAVFNLFLLAVCVSAWRSVNKAKQDGYYSCSLINAKEVREGTTIILLLFTAIHALIYID